MVIGKSHIYAGSRAEVQLYDDWSLAIVCGDITLTPKSRVFLSDTAVEMLPGLSSPAIPYIRIDWTDGAQPGLSAKWWQSLVAALRDIDGMVSLNCFGGHGRTGTALAILAALSGACPKDADPVAWVRAKYCDEAVETDEQIQYVEDITGHEVGVAGSRKVYVLPVAAAQTSVGYWDDQEGKWMEGQRPLPSGAGSGNSLVYSDDDEVTGPEIGSEEWWRELDPEADDTTV